MDQGQVSNDLNGLFERFRRDGEPEALGRVFDSTAPKLLQLAIHLVGDIGAAEDLVQSAFVTAIERASTFDASRSLDAWLSGILANHARDLKKAARREIDVASLAGRVEATPLEHALQTEWSSVLAKAIDAIPEPYRVTLILRLQHGMTPTEIAHALQRSPGAVRVQLHRGREMLRRLLPAGIVASAVFIAEPGRGLAQIKSKVLAEAALMKGSVGVAGLVGGLLMTSKLLGGVAALFLAILAFFLVRAHIHAPSTTARTTDPQPAAISSKTRESEETLSTGSPGSAARVAASVGDATKDAKTVKMHGRVVDSDSSGGIPNAVIALYPAHRQGLSDVRRRWHDRFEIYEDGSVDAVAWPRFGEKLSDAARLDAEEVDVYEPPSSDERAIAEATTSATGEFEIRAPASLGFLVCSADGYATRERALSPAEITVAQSGDASITIVLRAPRPLAGYVVDASMKRIEKRVRIAFVGHVNKPTPTAMGSDGTVTGGKPEAELQMDQWTVETAPDGSFECALPARMVYARSLEPDLGIVKQGFLRGGGSAWVHAPWSEPGSLHEPLVLVMKPIGSILVRDRDSHAPIEDICLQCTSRLDGQVLRYGRFFAPQGRLQLAPDGAVQENRLQKADEMSPCECTVWSEGHAPLTQTVESLIAGNVTEFDLERGDAPAVAGRIHDGPRGVDKARVKLLSLGWYSTWIPGSGCPTAITDSDSEGRFKVEAPIGRYVLALVSGEQEESRVVEIPLVAPIDIDLSIDTSIVAGVHDSSGVASASHPVVLRGFDGRTMKANTDPKGLARFSRLPAGSFKVQVMNAPTADAFRSEQEMSVELREGEQQHVEFVIGQGTPRFARVVLDESVSLEGWKASKGHGPQASWVGLETNGRIPIDIRWLTVVWVSAPNGREWCVYLPKDAPDGYEIRLSLDGLGYEGVLTSQATGEPLRGMRVIARAWNAPTGAGIATTVLTDEKGRFRITGLEDDAYSMRFEDAPRTDERDLIYVRPIARPSTPPGHLAIALPKRIGRGSESWGGHGFEGFEVMTVTGVIRRASGSAQGIAGFIGSVVARPGYDLTLYAEFVAGPNGSYEVRVPVASKFAATLHNSMNSTTYEAFPEVRWDAGSAGDREVHDIDLP